MTELGRHTLPSVQRETGSALRSQFAVRYQARFGETPTAVTALAYDAVRDILPALIRYTQTHHLPYTSESLKKALDAIGTFKG